MSQYDRAVFVLSVSKIDVEVLDLELLLYYILQVCISLLTSDAVTQSSEDPQPRPSRWQGDRDHL